GALQHAGGARAPRAHHRGGHGGRRGCAASRRPHALRAADARVARAAALGDSSPASRLSHGGAARMRRRSAAQPGQERDRRMTEQTPKYQERLARTVATTRAPSAIGPYSQGQVVRAGGLTWLYTAGQVGLDPAKGELVPGGAAEQAGQVMKNLAAVLAEAGFRFADVVKTTILLLDI